MVTENDFDLGISTDKIIATVLEQQVSENRKVIMR